MSFNNHMRLLPYKKSMHQTETKAIYTASELSLFQCVLDVPQKQIAKNYFLFGNLKEINTDKLKCFEFSED